MSKTMSPAAHPLWGADHWCIMFLADYRHRAPAIWADRRGGGARQWDGHTPEYARLMAALAWMPYEEVYSGVWHRYWLTAAELEAIIGSTP